MKIHYISCHAVLEYDEVKLFTEMGHEVFSNGAYRDPAGAFTLPRPGIPGMKFNQRWFELTAEHPQTNLPPEMIEPFDVLIFMHSPEALVSNWPKIKHKRVIFRSIGQCVPATERSLKRMAEEGLEIVRYSPLEQLIPEFAGGADRIIRFYKDDADFGGWIGDEKRPINFSQSLKGRGQFCHYDAIMASMVGFDGALIYGVGNNDLGQFNGGEVTYDKMRELYQHARAYVYAGTWPAQYTLSFIEAAMTGTPIVTFQESFLKQSMAVEDFRYFEVADLMTKYGLADFVCPDVTCARAQIQLLIDNDDIAQEVSRKVRLMAQAEFGKDLIKNQWKLLLEGTL